MTKEVRFRAAYDNRATGGSRHGMDMSLILKGQRGAVEAVIYTGWYPPEMQEKEIGWQGPIMGPVIFHTYYHRDANSMDDEEGQPCTILNAPCFGRWSSLMHEEEQKVLEALISGGDEAVWAKLQEIYNRIEL